MGWTPELERKTDIEAKELAKQEAAKLTFSQKLVKGTIGAKIFFVLAVLSLFGLLSSLFNFNFAAILSFFFLFWLFSLLFKRNEEDRLAREIYLQKKAEIINKK